MDIAVQERLAEFLFDKTRRVVLSLLFRYTGRAFFLREIVRMTGAGLGPVQRELAQLVKAGVVRKNSVGHRVYFQADDESAIFSELRNLMADGASGPVSRTLPHDLRQRFAVPKGALAEFCHRYHIRKLSLFGSVLRDDFGPDSDVDVLVEFEPGKTPGFGIVTIEDELSRLIGRKVDLRTPGELSRYFRADVVREARVQYESA